MAIKIIEEKTFEKARKKINEEKKKGNIVCFTSLDDELNRKILEKIKIDIFMPKLLGRKDYSKQRDSGFNQVLAKIAKKNKVTIAIDFKELKNSYGKARAKILSRIDQNIMLSKKNKLNMTFVSNEKKSEILALCLSLGMPTWMPKFFD